jgi:hypothetical protein
VLEEPNADEAEIEALVERLARPLGLRRDRPNDANARPARPGRPTRPNVSLKFKRRNDNSLTLRGRLLENLKSEFLIKDKRGRVWRVRKSKWAIHEATGA